MRNVNKINLNILNLEPGNTVLDVGSSSGYQAIEMARQGLVVYAIDNSGDLINKLKDKVSKEKVECFPVHADARSIPFEDGRFDCFVSTEVFEHIEGVEKVVEEAYRVLKPGGVGCVSVPTKISEDIFKKYHPTWLENSGHVNFFNKKNIVSLLENIGFNVYRFEQHNFEWSLFWLVHTMYKTKFDFTGTPIENHFVSDRFFRVWRLLEKVDILGIVKRIGNLILPKSYYIYVRKPI